MKIQLKQDTPKQINDPASAAAICRSILNAEQEIDRDKEHVWTIGLNSAKLIKYVELVSLGTLDASLIHPREIYRLAISKGVSAIIMLHNHPSDTMKPSQEDQAITDRLKAAGEILGIQLIDHVIIGSTEHYSFKQHDLI